MTLVLDPPAAPPPARWTAAEIERRLDGDHYELVYGELVEKPIGAVSSWVAARVLTAVGRHCDDSDEAYGFDGECGDRLFPDRPDHVRKPDVSIVRHARLPKGGIPSGFFAPAPDLAVEVVSPRDLFCEVDDRVGEYLRAGVQEVWVLSPGRHTLTIPTPGGVTQPGDRDTLEGGTLLPGFRYPVADLFPAPPDESG